jgi:hypothetical protein
MIFPLSLAIFVYNTTNLQKCISSTLQVKVHNNMKSTVFWNVMLFSLMKVNPYFRGTHCFHLQDQRVSQVRNQHEAGSKQNWFLTWCTPNMEVTCSCKMFAGFHQTTQSYITEELFTATAVRTSNLPSQYGCMHTKLMYLVIFHILTGVTTDSDTM